MNSTLSIIMKPRIHEAATDLAAGRTAYSLAREVLGLRAQVDELQGRCKELEETKRRLRKANEFRKDRLLVEEAALDLAERDLDDARALIEKITGKPFRLREALEAGEAARELQRLREALEAGEAARELQRQTKEPQP